MHRSVFPADLLKVVLTRINCESHLQRETFISLLKERQRDFWTNGTGEIKFTNIKLTLTLPLLSEDEMPMGSAVKESPP